MLVPLQQTKEEQRKRVDCDIWEEILLQLIKSIGKLEEGEAPTHGASWGWFVVG